MYTCQVLQHGICHVSHFLCFDHAYTPSAQGREFYDYMLGSERTRYGYTCQVPECSKHYVYLPEFLVGVEKSHMQATN